MKTGFLGLFLLGTVALLVLPFRFGTFGTNDFVEYWSAFKVAAVDGNPYDPQILLEAQRSAGSTSASPLMMWNPPWLLVLLSPILQLPFTLSARVFGLISLLCGLISVCIWERVFSESLETSADFKLRCAAVYFAPAYLCLQLGQIGMLLLLFVSVMFWALKRERFPLAGVALAFCTLKPHLFYLLNLFFLWYCLRERRMSGILGFLIAAVLLFLSSKLVFPVAFDAWKAVALGEPPAGVTQPLQWQVATLVGVVRALFADERGMVPIWPMAVIPGVTAIATLFVLLKRREALVLENTFPMILGLSLLTSPFGWLFDHTCLLPLQVAALWEARRSRRFWLTSAVLGLNAAVFCAQGVLKFHHQYWWYAAAMSILYYFAIRGPNRWSQSGPAVAS